MKEKIKKMKEMKKVYLYVNWSIKTEIEDTYPDSDQVTYKSH